MITHRPDAILQARVAAERLAHNTRVETDPAYTVAVERPLGDRLDAEMRQLAAAHPAVASGWGLHNSAYATVLIDAAGEPVDEPTSDKLELLARWRANPALWSGVPCSPATDLFGLRLDEAGWAWLRKAAEEPRFSMTRRRENADLAALGIPTMDPDRGTRVRDLNCAMVHLGEIVGTPQIRQVALGPFDSDEEMWRASVDALPKPGRTRAWPVWSWPTGWTLPARPRRHGVAFLRAVPADRAILADESGIRWQALTWPRPFSAPPEWLMQAMGARRG